MTASVLGLEKCLELGGPFLLCTNGQRKQSSRLVGPPFLAVKLFTTSRQAMVDREA